MRVHVPLVVCDDAVIDLTLVLIALVIIVVFVVAIFHRILLYWKYTVYTRKGEGVFRLYLHAFCALTTVRGASLRRLHNPIAPSEFIQVQICITRENPVSSGVGYSCSHHARECFVTHTPLFAVAEIDGEDVYTFLAFFSTCLPLNLHCLPGPSTLPPLASSRHQDHIQKCAVLCLVLHWSTWPH